MTDSEHWQNLQRESERNTNMERTDRMYDGGSGGGGGNSGCVILLIGTLTSLLFAGCCLI